MKNKLIYSIIATLLISFSAHADIVCVKKRAAVNNNQVRVARTVVRLTDTDTCPSGYKLVADDFNLVQREEYEQTLASLPTKEETDVLVGKVEEFTELIGDENSGFTKQILDLDNAVNNPVTGLVGKANQVDLDAVSDRVTTVEGVVGDNTAGLVKQVADLDATVNDATTGLATKASQGDLTALDNIVNDTNTGLATKASQASLTDVSTRVATLEDAVGDDTTGLASKASQADLTALANIVNDTNTGLATKASQTDFTSLATSVGTNSTNIASASNRILDLETTVGNANSGLVKTVGNADSGLVKDNNTNKANIATLITTVGDEESGLVQDVAEAQTNIETLTNALGDRSSGLIKDVSDLSTTVGDAENGLVKDVAALQAESEIRNLGLIPYGSNVSGIVEVAKAADGSTPTSQLIGLPLTASVPLSEDNIIIDDSNDNEDGCTGNATDPSAPAGKVCVYVFEGDETKLDASGIARNCSLYNYDEAQCTVDASCLWTAAHCEGDADGCIGEADPSIDNCSAHNEGGSCIYVTSSCSPTAAKPFNRGFRLINSDDSAPIAATWIYQEVDAPQY